MKLNEQEIKDILSQHTNEKNRKGFFLEQVSDIKSQLQQFIDTKCIPEGKVVTMRSSSPTVQLPQNKQYAIENKSKIPGRMNYFFIDLTFGYFENGKFTTSPSKWNCDHLQTAQLAKTKTDAEATTADLKRKQEEYIGTLLKSNPSYKKDPTEAEKLSLKATSVPAPKDIFPNGLTLWYDPSTQSTLKKSSSPISTKLEQQEINRDVCRTYIDEFYTSFKRKNSIVIDPASFETQKYRAQACKDAYYNDWGVLGGGKKLDQYLDILTGNKEGGPTSYGEDAKWRLK